MPLYDFRKIIRESIPILGFCVLLELVGGNFLDSTKSTLLEMPIILVLIPVVNGLGGNLGTIFGSRLSSGMHLGLTELSWKDKKLWEDIRLSFLVGLLIFLIMTLAIWFLAPLMGVGVGDLRFGEFFAIAILAGIFATVIAIGVSVFTAFLSFKQGIDPDNVVTPLVTTLGDISGIFLIIIFFTIIV